MLVVEFSICALWGKKTNDSLLSSVCSACMRRTGVACCISCGEQTLPFDLDRFPLILFAIPARTAFTYDTDSISMLKLNYLGLFVLERNMIKGKYDKGRQNYAWCRETFPPAPIIPELVATH